MFATILLNTTFLSLAPAAVASVPAAPEFELEALIAELDERVPQLLEGMLVPGAALALIEDGVVVWERGYGLADVATGKPVTPETVFNIGSISKTIAAWGVMKLVEDGELALDAPVEDKLTRWKLPPSEFDSSQVTVRRLLSHTAGLSLHGYPGFESGDALPSVEASLDGATNGSGAVTMIYEPGTAWRYSGGGYTIAQLLVEEVTGKTFAEYMRGVFPALGMETTDYAWPDDLRKLTSTCYDQLGNATYNPRFTAQAAASLKTTAGSLARFGTLIFESPDGKPAGRGFLRPETVDLMLTPQEGSNGTYGIGYQTNEEAPGVQVFGHGGANHGWHANLKLLREERAGLVALTNGSNGYHVLSQIANICADRRRATSRWRRGGDRGVRAAQGGRARPLSLPRVRAQPLGPRPHARRRIRRCDQHSAAQRCGVPDGLEHVRQPCARSSHAC